MLLDGCVCGCVIVYAPVVDAWSKEDCLTLLERIRSLLPDGDAMKYKTTESHFDWEKVCFGDFTGDMCKQKWAKVSTEVSQLQVTILANQNSRKIYFLFWICGGKCHKLQKTMSVASFSTGKILLLRNETRHHFFLFFLQQFQVRP